MSSILKYAGYSAWFSLCLVTLIYFTFPVDRFKGQVENELEKMMGQGKQGKYGVDPVVKIDSLSMSGFPGIKAKRVSVQLGSRDPDPGASFLIDEVKGVGGIFSTLLGSPSGVFSLEAYGGSIDGSVSLAKPVPAKGGKVAKNAAYQLRTLNVEVEDIDISRILVIQEKAQVPVTGKLVGTIELDLGEQPDKEAQGVVDLTIQNVNLGPGEVKVPLLGGLTIPTVNLGDVVAKIDIDKGKGQTDNTGMNGKDVQANVDAGITFNRSLKMSRVKGDGWFKISEEFLKNNSKFSILDAVPMMTKAKNDEGQYEIAINGMLRKPSVKLAKKRGKKK